jgi:hypothetical protein
MNDFSYTPLHVYAPKDTVSEELLKSIPKKVYFWVQSLVDDIEQRDCFGNLTWHFNDETSTIILGDQDDSENYVQIWWEGDAYNPINLCGSDERFEHIIDNMDFFSQLEENIYAELEDFEEELDK